MGSKRNRRSKPKAPTRDSREARGWLNSAISARMMEKAEGCLLRCSSGNSAGNGFRVPRRVPLSIAKESQCGCGASTGSSRRLRISPRAIERGEDHLAVARRDLEWRSQRSDVPTRIPPRKFITGGKVDAALRIELAQQRVQTPAERDFGMRALDGNAAGRGINFGTHKKSAEGAFRISC